MNYLFISLGGLFTLIILLRMRKSFALILRRNNLTGKRFIHFFIMDKYTRGKRPELFYHLRLISEDKRYKISVPVSKTEYDRMKKGSEYGILPLFYDDHNEKIYIIGSKKEILLKEALQQDINYVIFSLIFVIITIFVLYYAYYFIL